MVAEDSEDDEEVNDDSTKIVVTVPAEFAGRRLSKRLRKAGPESGGLEDTTCKSTKRSLISSPSINHEMGSSSHTNSPVDQATKPSPSSGVNSPGSLSDMMCYNSSEFHEASMKTTTAG